MIIDEIRRLYEADADKKIGKGNPTGSRFGTCAAQSQMLLHPGVSHPEPPRARTLMTFEEGDMVERWWGQAIERAYPNQSGLSQEPFYLSVPLNDGAVDALRTRIQARKLWGTVEVGFHPPTIQEGPDGRVKLRLVRRDARDPSRPAKLGFVLDPDAKVVYAPTYVDRVIKHPELGLVVLEKKAVSNYAFRRALLGELDYTKRCQLAGMVAATGLGACWLLYRKETAHLCEILYTHKAERVRVQITKLNGQSEVYFTQPGKDTVLTPDGQEVELPGDATWETAATWTPFDASLVEQIRERIRRVLLFDGALANLHREYGPSFTCAKCGGVGRRTCGTCKGTGKTAKLGRPCGPCDGKTTVLCEHCGGVGQLEETELPAYPCGYCPVVGTCYPFARLQLDSRPRYFVKREDHEAAGLAFVSPERG